MRPIDIDESSSLVRLDACVVGAGPAGIAAATTLARGGADVILLDRHPHPGGKACGGGISREGWEAARLDGESDGSPSFARLKVNAPLGSKVVNTGEPFVRIVDRVKWQAGLIEEASRAGCEVRPGTRFLRFEGGVVHTDGGDLTCDFLVGADGASSRTRRMLGLGRGATVIARQATVSPEAAEGAGLRVDMPQVFFSPRLFGSGYGWSFPAPDGIRLGCGAPSSRLTPAQLRDSYSVWVRSLGFDPAGLMQRVGTIGCDYRGHRFGRVRLAGDAAGLASPVTGEGISQALLSGVEVAREILEPGYRSDVIPALATRHRRTDGVLRGAAGGLLFHLAPALLSIPLVRTEAVRRYCR